MAVSIQKTISSTSIYYTGGGDTTITLAGVNSIVIHSKKTMIKVNRPKNKSRQLSENSDNFDNLVVDLKQGNDEIQVKGWIEDDGTSTAWSKAWKLRAMCSNGGALTNLTIEDIQFTSSTRQAFLDDVSFDYAPDDTGAIQTSAGSDVARIQVQLNFFIGIER